MTSSAGQATPEPGPPPDADPQPGVGEPRGGPAVAMLALATVGFATNFWAWALLSPLGPTLRNTAHLSPFSQALVVAVPVLVGSLGRIPVGMLTDRFGGRVMFPLVSFATIPPVLVLGWFGRSSPAVLVAGGFFLGVGGTAFAVGVPFVNGWFPASRRGLALGVFGAGMGGTAVSALTTVRLVDAHGFAAPFLVAAAALACYGLVAAVVLRDAPGRAVPAGPVLGRLGTAARAPIAWRASLLYAVAFGGFVAFGVYLPTYLRNAYSLGQADASNRMAGFVLLAVVMRPFGGWLSDRLRPGPVLAGSLLLAAAGAFVQSATPGLYPIGTVAFLTMAATLGAASGAVFALVARRAPAGRVGSVTGLVGAAGGLGGFVPPLVMGSLFGHLGTYAPGLVALGVVAAGAVALAVETTGRKEPADA